MRTAGGRAVATPSSTARWWRTTLAAVAVAAEAVAAEAAVVAVAAAAAAAVAEVAAAVVAVAVEVEEEEALPATAAAAWPPPPSSPSPPGQLRAARAAPKVVALRVVPPRVAPTVAARHPVQGRAWSVVRSG